MRGTMIEAAAAATESAEQPQSEGSDDEDGLEHAAEAATSWGQSADQARLGLQINRRHPGFL
jgi:hypothetical protein